jgi:hypothetical protein
MNSTQSNPIKKTITPDNVLASVSKYQKANKEKMHLKCKRYYERVMADPVRRAALKDKQKLYRENAKLKKSLQQ